MTAVKSGVVGSAFLVSAKMEKRMREIFTKLLTIFCLDISGGPDLVGLGVIWICWERRDAEVTSRRTMGHQ